MAQIITLTDRKTGEAVYPVTSTKSVFDEKGVDLDTLLTLQKQETENALKGYAKKTDLTGKQDALTDSLDVKVSGTALAVTERAKRAVFDDLWNTVWGLYGKYDPKNAPDPEHPYMGNDIWMTYEEALIVMNEKDMAINPYFCTIKGRTTVPHESYRDSGHGILSYRFINCPNLEVLCISRGALRFTGDCFGALSKCPKLKKIIGQWWLHNTNASSTNLLVECPEIEEFQFYIGFSLNLGNCPKVSRNSIKFLIDYAQNGTKGIIITLHADTYAKLTAAADDPDDEWYGIIDLAAAKQITFACA